TLALPILKSLYVSPHWMQGSIASCDANAVWLPRYSSYRPGARNEVPLVERRRRAELICQFRPSFQTWSVPGTESYWNARAEALSFRSSNIGLPTSNGTSISVKASTTWSSPTVSWAELWPQRSPPLDSSLGWSLML